LRIAVAQGELEEIVTEGLRDLSSNITQEMYEYSNIVYEIALMAQQDTYKAVRERQEMFTETLFNAGKGLDQSEDLAKNMGSSYDAVMKAMRAELAGLSNRR
jgi:hypothetical protein